MTCLICNWPVKQSSWLASDSKPGVYSRACGRVERVLITPAMNARPVISHLVHVSQLLKTGEGYKASTI